MKNENRAGLVIGGLLILTGAVFLVSNFVAGYHILRSCRLYFSFWQRGSPSGHSYFQPPSKAWQGC